MERNFISKTNAKYMWCYQWLISSGWAQQNKLSLTEVFWNSYEKLLAHLNTVELHLGCTMFKTKNGPQETKFCLASWGKPEKQD